MPLPFSSKYVFPKYFIPDVKTSLNIFSYPPHKGKFHTITGHEGADGE
jgi:hypothetical protein